MENNKNVKFEYLYRDAGNYKNWGEVVFFNRKNMAIEDINKQITNNLMDNLYFVAAELNINDLHSPSYDPELDHDFHEFY